MRVPENPETQEQIMAGNKEEEDAPKYHKCLVNLFVTFLCGSGI